MIGCFRVVLCLLTLLGSVSSLQAGLPADFDSDGDVDIDDFGEFQNCFTGPGLINDVQNCGLFDTDDDGDVDLRDFSDFQLCWSGPGALADPSCSPSFVPARVIETSPADGEADVALTRETIIKLDTPIQASTLNNANIFGKFAEQPLQPRIHCNPAEDKISLFFPPNLPSLPDSARVRITIVGDTILDIYGVPIDPDGDGIEGGTLTFDFDTLGLTQIPNTIVQGRVFASELTDQGMNVPLEGVTVYIDGIASPGAVTDNLGNFTLTNAPAGRFFVHVHGTTATNTPPGFYYPIVNELFESIPGQTVTTYDIHLPAVELAAISQASMTQETTVGLTQQQIDDFVAANPGVDPAALQAIQLMVPADSLFADDGSRGGMVGLAPVPSDRLPAPLPEGIDLPIVLTVQTDGINPQDATPTNFDIPAPICLPNLPNSTTGETLKPGDASALISFNHDLGSWEVVAPMRVSEDGLSICTEAGGLVAPGWHGTSPLCEARFRGPTDDDCPACADSYRNWQKSVDTCIGNSGLAALSGILPADIACIYSGTTAFTSDLIQCNANSDDLDTCTLTGFKNWLASVASSCIPIEGVGVGAATGAIVEAVQSCNDLSSKEEAYRACRQTHCPIVHIKANNELNNLAVGQLARQGLLFTIAADLGSAVLGTSKWANTDPSDFQDQLAIFQGVHDSIQEASELGEQISASERQTIIDLPLPSGVDQADVDALISRTNDWVTGALTQSDIDAAAINQAAVELADFASELEQEGWSTTLDGYTLGFGSPVLLSDDTSESIGQNRQRSYLYKLSDLHSGAVQRGRTTLQGTIPSLNIRPNAVFMLELLDPDELEIAIAHFLSGPSGSTVAIPAPVFMPLEPSDTDGDSLPDEGEAVVGTSSTNPDTDADGVTDLLELQQGTNPLDGFQSSTGIIASTDTPGTARDVCAVEGVAVVADGSAGVRVFNVNNAENPIAVAAVSTPGDAIAVACEPGSELIAVADGNNGLAVIDIADPPAALVKYNINIGSYAQAVAVANQVAYVGTQDSRVVRVDMAAPSILGATTFDAQVHDVGVAEDRVYVLTGSSLYVTSPTGQILGSVAAPGIAPGSTGRRRLFVAEGIAYATQHRGYDTFDVTNPGGMVKLGGQDTSQFGWRHFVANGSGLGITAAGPNGNMDPPGNVQLYDVSNPAVTDDFVTEFETPGIALGVAVFNGLAYVADGASGLHVINYLPYDTQQVPPAVSMSTNISANQIPEGQPYRVTATVTDDVQVRDVHLLLDGEVVASDGSYPFEFRLNAPILADTSVIALSLRATDTGGNTATTTPVNITVVVDDVPPTVTNLIPRPGFSTSLEIRSVAAFFDEPIAPSSVNESTFTLLWSGPDGELDNGSDTLIQPFSLRLNSFVQGAFFQLFDPLEPGVYRATLTTGIRDLKGNLLGSPVIWEFSTDTTIDTDGDGLPDGIEGRLGLNISSTDSDNDGTPDGDEDTDGDNVINRAELINLTDPANPDTDSDNLNDGAEPLALTDALDSDTDDDGFPDGDEVNLLSDPLDPDSIPVYEAVSNGLMVRNNYHFQAVSKGFVIRNYAPVVSSGFVVKNLYPTVLVSRGLIVRNTPSSP